MLLTAISHPRGCPEQSSATVRHHNWHLARFPLRPAAILCAVASIILCNPTPVIAGDCPGSALGYMITVQGIVEISSSAGGTWQLAKLDTLVCVGDIVRVGERSRAGIYFADIETVTYIDQNTTTRAAERPTERSLVLDLLEGAIHFLSREPRSLEVRTPFVNAGVKGTEFQVRVELDRPAAERPRDPFTGRAIVNVTEGNVQAQSAQATTIITNGQAVEARADCPSGLSTGEEPACVAPPGVEPLRSINVNQDVAVQWALYYQPVLIGQLAGAPIAIIEASRLLEVGQVDEARSKLTRIPDSSPAAAEKYALLTVIEIARSDRTKALEAGIQAVKVNPSSSAAKIALSYAQQANFELEAARDTLLKAVEQQPRSALAWARLAELWLSLGYRDKALNTAQRAARLAPNLERVHLVFGFAALARVDVETAKSAFGKAIQLDSADPAPRLGLGLAKIRAGELVAGRKEIEIAAGLDPRNSLIRSYLGKAYFEEKRDPLDAIQFDLAKQIDPKDPTPYLYDAIRKQTENSPVAALKDLQASIDRNDNRAVYRSRLALDQDRAARGASLGRIYDDLGFHELGELEATRSLTLDPASASAHRFLSDTYRGDRRFEISRVSELLQAQLLQDININPVQPSLTETNLNIITRGGPAEAGFNEFTPLFERNQVQADVSGVVGNEDALGGESVVSALYDQLSISAGAFHYETDGWRPNNDINHEIYNLYAQYAITPELNAQVEIRHRDSKEGDLAFNFDPDDFSPTLQNELDQDVARAGLRYSPTPNSDFLLSYIFSDRDGSAHDAFAVGPFLLSFENLLDQETHQMEGQYILWGDWLNLLTGVSYNNTETEEQVILSLNGDPLIDDRRKFGTDDYRGYAYANINFPESLTWTLGVSYTSFDEDGDPGHHVHKFNPKVGVQWNIADDLRFRAAYIETVKPSLAANRTLEPTQIAGFNQFFTEFTATKSRRYGFGLDWQVTPDLAIGGEMTWRDIEEPFIDADANKVVEDDATEQLYQGYIYWTPWDELAVRTGFAYDKYEKDSAAFSERVGNFNPLEVETISVPVNLSYFRPSGFFARAGVTWVHQEVERLPVFSNQGHDSFPVVDVGIGYRFPKRRGIVSLQVTNLLDEEFHFEDDSFRVSTVDNEEPLVGPYIPDRRIMARMTLNF